MNKIILSQYLEQEFETDSDASYWFGYYNYDPLSLDSDLLLCGRIEQDGGAPQNGQTIEVGFFNTKTGDWNPINRTDSWNWQQGAMTQWLPGEKNESKIIFNTSRARHLKSIIVDIVSGETRVINWAIYGLTPDGRKSISLDLERSYWCRAYHYQSVANPEKEGRVVAGDGIFEIDLQNNTRRLIIDINDILAMDAEEDFDKKKHWLEHIMINPSGTRFCFLHRYSSVDNVYSYKTRLFLANIDGSGLSIVPGWENVDWSHFGWRGDNGFAIYTYQGYRHPISGNLKNIVHSPLKLGIKLYNAFTYRYLPYSLSKKLNGKRQYYQLYSIGDNNQAKLTDTIESSLFCIDGHPSFTTDGRYMITDSYPDRKGYQRLIVYDTITKKGILIAKLFAGLKGTPASCDLHPKLSRDNQKLCVDTAYDGRHHMLVFKLNWSLISNVLK